MKIVWTRRASRHLRAAYDYWARESSSSEAKNMLARIFSAVELLESYPEAGRGGRVPGTRELVIVPTPFLIAYRIHSGKIEILALLHGARKWPDNL
ncbi:MAG: type II toxin-antitoxin system RelE/ParE family toxin [Candidatus Sulfotelmatobacter sp.]